MLIGSRGTLLTWRRVGLYSRSLSRAPAGRSYGKAQMSKQIFTCDIDAEPLHRYREGGYHPLGLGQVLNDGRYKVTHKLGCGGYSTTWAAKDQDQDRYVAIKICIAEKKTGSELEILQRISVHPKHNGEISRLNQMLDYFHLNGPNGIHDCFVLEMLGPSVADIVDSYCKDDRLPAKLAKAFAKQALEGLHALSAQRIGHGDIHTRNLAMVIPNLHSMDERSFFDMLGQPETAPVSSEDGKPLTKHVPTQLVRPARFRRKSVFLSSPSVKIIDFGEAFLYNKIPSTLHTPLAVRAPEVVFGDLLDRRVDLWSAGCLLFELVTGQPPFDVIMLTPPQLVQQMLEFSTDELPSRWKTKWHEMQKELPSDEEGYTLQEWLNEVYFHSDKNTEFTENDIEEVGRLVTQMLKFEPSRRASVDDILSATWFK